LPAIGLGKVELAFAGWLFPFRKKRRELRFDLRPDFIATGSNARTDRREYVQRIGAEIVPHAFERTFHKLRSGSAPARVHSRDRACPGIQKQNGNTIGSSDADALPDLVRDQGVAFGMSIEQSMCVQNLV